MSFVVYTSHIRIRYIHNRFWLNSYLLASSYGPAWFSVFSFRAFVHCFTDLHCKTCTETNIHNTHTDMLFRLNSFPTPYLPSQSHPYQSCITARAPSFENLRWGIKGGYYLIIGSDRTPGKNPVWKVREWADKAIKICGGLLLAFTYRRPLQYSSYQCPCGHNLQASDGIRLYWPAGSRVDIWPYTGNDATVKAASLAFCRVCLEIQAGGVNLTGMIRGFVTCT